jgi:hypothetical protein
MKEESTKGRKEERKEERKEGRKEERKEGRKGTRHSDVHGMTWLRHERGLHSLNQEGR